MSTKGRGFIRIDPKERELDRWPLPDYSDPVTTEKPTALNYDPAYLRAVEQEVVEEEPIVVEELTADALEQIRQSAADEGFEQGHAEGLAQGLQEGHEQGLAQGVQEGHAEGFAQGFAEAKEKIEQRCQALDALLSKLAFPLRQMDDKVQQQMLDVVMHLANVVIDTEVRTNSQVIINTLQEVIATMPLSDVHLHIHLHPEDLALIENEYSNNLPQDCRWSFTAQPSFARGDIKVFCQDSVVDYPMHERIEQTLAKFMTQNRARLQSQAQVLADEFSEVQKTGGQISSLHFDAPPTPSLLDDSSHPPLESQTAAEQEMPAEQQMPTQDAPLLEQDEQNHDAK
ncbi:MAG: flagellar assembly protein FliH [Vibrionaceae bacterium]